MKKKCCIKCDDVGNCAFADCNCHLNNVLCKTCGKRYCYHYESDFDREVEKHRSAGLEAQIEKEISSLCKYFEWEPESEQVSNLTELFRAFYQMGRIEAREYFISLLK